MTDYTGFSGDPELQEGNYLALKFDATDGATTKVKLVGGSEAEATLDSDMQIVIRVDGSTGIIATATKGDKSISKTYTFDLVLEEEE